MTGKLDRPKLTTAILAAHGIHYHKTEYILNGTQQTRELPKNVNDLREALLDTSSIEIPISWKAVFQKEEVRLREKYEGSELDLCPPDATYIIKEDFKHHFRGKYWKEELERLDMKMRDAREIQDTASELEYDAEERWIDFLRTHIFRDFRSEHKIRSERARHSETALDEYGLEGNVLWTESQKAFQWKENFTPGIRQRTGPKPDLTYGFRSHETSDRRWSSLMLQYNRNLSFDVLGKLRASQSRILPAVTSGLFKWQSWKEGNGKEPRTLLGPDRLCFPWAVVEVKHAQVLMPAEEYCQCKLANATACAYDIRENLIRSVDVPSEIPPMIGFTCVGPKLRLWLTYRGDDNQIQMVCVWATRLDSTWGVYYLTEIIRNMHLWVSKLLHGTVVHYIERAHRKLAAVAVADARSLHPTCEDYHSDDSDTGTLINPELIPVTEDLHPGATSPKTPIRGMFSNEGFLSGSTAVMPTLKSSNTLPDSQSEAGMQKHPSSTAVVDPAQTLPTKEEEPRPEDRALSQDWDPKFDRHDHAEHGSVSEKSGIFPQSSGSANDKADLFTNEKNAFASFLTDALEVPTANARTREPKHMKDSPLQRKDHTGLKEPQTKISQDAEWLIGTESDNQDGIYYKNKEYQNRPSHDTEWLFGKTDKSTGPESPIFIEDSDSESESESESDSDLEVDFGMGRETEHTEDSPLRRNYSSSLDDSQSRASQDAGRLFEKKPQSTRSQSPFVTEDLNFDFGIRREPEPMQNPPLRRNYSFSLDDSQSKTSQDTGRLFGKKPQSTWTRA
ncbi:hypothetical protein K491DRAFT_713180 [Lophiostoma macrostomum CBS 122681]|uniref:Uncharacterized protein n=1 Tax=Lophiostoma macrostomum CBS 122681 TaxID=1314788 RepID=A0A6A6TG41_9PLEO|nr:hypothetical protein K491DRAFT_713180 [Lophiostoma macrostomum CBS 122681]